MLWNIRSTAFFMFAHDSVTDIILNKDKKKQPQKHNPQKKHIKRTVKDELLQSSNFILPRVFSPLFDF